MHLMAKEYGKLPSELLALDWWEYEFNTAVLMTGVEEMSPKKKKGQPPSAAQLAQRKGR